MLRKTFFIAVILLIAIAGVLSAQIKFPVTDDGTPLTYGKVVSVDGTNPNQVVAADGTDRTTDVVGVVVAVQGTDYLVITSGYLELSGASFTPGDRLTVNATGDIVTSANDEDILIGYAISATRVQILIDDDQARFTYFDDSFSGIGADNVQDAIDSLVDMIGDITSEDITFEGVVTFDSTVIFNDDTVYFGGPVIFDSTVVFNGPVDAETIYVGWLIGTQNDTIYFEQYLAGPEVVIDSIEAFGDGPIVIKDSTEFREKVTFESEIIVEGDLTVQGAATFDSTVYIAEGLEVDGDATFHDNVYVDDSLFAGYIDVDQMVVNDTLFANIIDADSAFFNYVETGDLVVNDSAYFGGPSVFGDDVTMEGDLTVQGDGYFEQNVYVTDTLFAGVIDVDQLTVNDSAYFGGPSVFGDDVTIEGDLTVEGDGYFEQNVYVTDTLFAGVIEAGNINADSIFSEYTETEVLVVTDSAYFGGPAYFDTTVVFGDDSVYFGGPVIFDSTVVFVGPIDADTINVGWLIGTQNDTIYFEQYLAGPEVVIDSIEAFGEGPIVIKDSTEFREKVTFEDEIIVEGDLTVEGAATFDSTVYIAEGLEVDGDATFHDNVYVDDSLFAGYIDVDQMVVNDTLFANIIDADSAFFNYVETGDLVVNDSGYFGGPSVFGDDVTIEGDLTVEGDGYFEQNVYVTDTLFAGVIEAGNINADSIFSEYTETEVLVVTDSAYFGGPAYFDTTVVFGDDSVYFGGPVVFDSTVVFNGDVVLDQNIVQASRSAVLEFDTTPTEAIALTFTTSGDVIKLMATVIVSDEYSTTPNYNGAKITVELYDVTNTTVLKSYTVFLQDKDWYEIKEVSITHVMSAPAADNDYSVRCFADGWGNGGRIIEGDLTVTAIQQ